MLNGWFFVQGNVGGWLSEMLRGKHAWVLENIRLDPSAVGKSVAWAPSPCDSDGSSLYLPPVDQPLHVPYNSKKAVQGIFISPTVRFLTAKLAGQIEAKRAVVVDEAEQAEDAGRRGEDEARGSKEQQPRKRRRDSWNEYVPVDLDMSLFPDGKYRGKYSDQGEGDL